MRGQTRRRAGNPPPAERTLARLEEECRRAAEAGLTRGVVAAAGTTLADVIVWAWGDAAVEPRRVPMTTEAVFDLASLTKVVATASACAICIGRGLLDPDAPAARYLPRLGQLPGSTIRVRDLGAHVSGYDNTRFWHLPAAEFLRLTVEAPPCRPAGTRYEYSCRNFILLGMIVEQVSGERLDIFCERNIFAPLGMSRTRFGPLADTGAGPVVPTREPPGVISDEQARSAGRPVGNAGLFSAVGDLARFARMMLAGGTLFGPSSWRLLTSPCTPPELPARSFGWDMRPRADNLHRPARFSPAAIGHGGWTGQSIWLDPRQGFHVIILTNRTHELPYATTLEASCAFRGRLADILTDHLRREARRKTGR